MDPSHLNNESCVFEITILFLVDIYLAFRFFFPLFWKLEENDSAGVDA